MHTILVGLAAVVFAQSSLATPHERDYNDLAPLLTPSPPPTNGPLSHLSIQTGRSPADYLIRDNYIVVLKKGLPQRHFNAHKQKVLSLWRQDSLTRFKATGYNPFQGLKHEYNIAEQFRGYSLHVSKAIVDLIRRLPEVAYVELDSKVWINDPFFTKSNTIAVNENNAVANAQVDIEYGAPWGLARISHRHRLKFSTFNVYPFEDLSGAGVDVYVIDTGVNCEHEELEGRAKWGKTIPEDVSADSNGHGSHVAGTIASRAYGVAKNATIIAVKVLGAGGSGSMSDVVAGVVWAAEAAAIKAREESKKPDSKHKGSVANMSLGGGKSGPLDDAVNAAVKSGLHFAVAAGNDNRDACTFSPAAAKRPITVGASTIQDERAYFSNHGSCVDIFAPGLNIKSIWNSGPRSINTISGTSMASPHIAGLAAYFLSIYPEYLDLAALGLSAEDDDDEDEAIEDDYFFVDQNSAWNTISSNGQIAFGKVKDAFGFKKNDGKVSKYAGLSPKLLKKAMIKLSTSDVLEGLPAKTCNYLAYNNATST